MGIQSTFSRVSLLDSPEAQLGDLLFRICEKLQLSPSQYDQARDRYTAVATFLSEEGALARFQPKIYSIGSMRMGTTVKAKGKAEIDLDFVCEFESGVWGLYSRANLLDLVEARLLENRHYRDMMERFDQCIRIRYANEFNMDIVPAIPSPPSEPGVLLIPDDTVDGWIATDPVGYANWFIRRSQYSGVHEYKSIEELPELEAADEKSPLQHTVQLLKRARDVMFSDGRFDMAHAPTSILLSTLAAEQFTGATSVVDAMNGLLSRLYQIATSSSRTIVVLDPVMPERILSEALVPGSAAHRQFCEWIKLTYETWCALIGAQGEAAAKHLQSLFGEFVTVEAYNEQLKYIQELRTNGQLKVQAGSGLILPRQESERVSIPKNTFYGR